MATAQLLQGDNYCVRANNANIEDSHDCTKAIDGRNDNHGRHFSARSVANNYGYSPLIH